jgi:hypothetical protein
MRNDLAQADAVNTALANERGRAANDAVTGRLRLAASPRPRPRGVFLLGAHGHSVLTR